jgi:hypothetical protein
MHFNVALAARLVTGERDFQFPWPGEVPRLPLTNTARSRGRGCLTTPVVPALQSAGHGFVIEALCSAAVASG